MSSDRLQFLIVEDDEDDYVHVSQLLRHSVNNVEVERAASAEVALRLAGERAPDLWFLDYRLGGRDGLEILRELKSRDVASPIIFLTGQGDEEVAVQAMKAGASDYLLKSKLSAPSLGSAVRFALTLHKKEEAVVASRRALQASERRFRALVENSTDVIAMLDKEATILYVSQSVRRVMGHAPERLVATCVFDFIHPDDVGGVRAVFSLLLKSPGASARAEYRMRHQDGGWRHLEATVMNRLEDPAVNALVFNERDVTERRVAEQALRMSEQRYRTLVESANEGIWRLDAEGVTTFVNAKMAEMLGYAPAEMIGRSLYEFHGASDRKAVQRRMDEQRQRGVGMQLDTRLVRQDGRELWVLLNSTPMFDADGGYSGACAMVTDITERRRAEEALRGSEERYRLLFERNLAGVFRTSADGEFVEANDSLSRMFGYETGKELRGRNTSEFVENPEEREKLVQELEARNQVVSYQLNARRKDGSTACLLMNSTILRDKEGKISGREGTVLDITERRALEEQLLHSQKMDAVGQLAGGVAHDFNNLLMVVSSYAELLLQSICASNAKAQHQAQQILKAARRAAGLTRQLLAFSRKQAISPCMLDLNLVVAEFARMLPRLLGEDIELVVRAGDSLWMVKADPLQIEQVIMNLAVNARDAMPRGGQLALETSNVCLDAEYARRHVGVTAGEYVLLTVSDTGCGIAPEVLPHIFEPFFTTKEQGKGTGLGLPTVYGSVKQSGGFVWVNSEVNRGSVFKVYLPRAGDGAEPAVKEERATVKPLHGFETILVVEDEEAVREATCEYLTLHGYNVLQAVNGADAVDTLEHFGGQMHLVMTDVVMPGMSGGELARKVRELQPGMPVLFISGYTETMVVQYGIEPGSGFLQKPFTLAAMVEKVREMLDRGPSGPSGDQSGAVDG